MLLDAIDFVVLLDLYANRCYIFCRLAIRSIYAIRCYRFCVSFGKFQGQISAGYTNNVPLAVSQD